MKNWLHRARRSHKKWLLICPFESNFLIKGKTNSPQQVLISSLILTLKGQKIGSKS